MRLCRLPRRYWCAIIAAAACLAIAKSSGAEPPDTTPSWATLCQAAKTAVRPITAADLNARREAALAAVDALGKRLDADVDADNGAAWKRWLKWDALRRELEKEKPDLRALAGYYRNYASGDEGTNLVWFAEVRRLLRQYFDTATAAAGGKWQASYDKALDDLAADLAEFAKTPAPDQAVKIGATLRYLEDIGQAPELVSAIRRECCRPNLFVEISRDAAGGWVDGSVDDDTPVRDCILKVALFGAAHTDGQSRLQLAPDGQKAVMETIIHGTTHSSTVGYRGPVTVYANSVTSLVGLQRMSATTAGLTAEPAAARAATSSNIYQICTRHGSRLMQWLAWRKAGKQKSEADAIASQHAAAQFRDRITQESRDSIANANRQYNEQMRTPLMEHRLFPRDLRLSSTSQAIEVVGLQGDASQLTTRQSPPPLPGPADLAVRVHESLVNNSAAVVLAGMRLSEEALRSEVTNFLPNPPESLRSQPQDLPTLTMNFPAEQPLTVAFANDGIDLTIRINSFVEEDGPRFNEVVHINVHYKFEKTATGFDAVRQGRIEYVLPRHQKGGSGTPAATTIVGRTLNRHFERVFEERIALKALDVKNRDGQKTGELQPTELRARDGWLTMTATKSAAATAAATP